MAISFASLPFPFPESQREALLQWREAAIAKERELSLQRQARIQQLRDYVQQRLRTIEAKKQLALQKREPSQERETDHESPPVTNRVAISLPGPSTTLMNQLTGQGVVTAHGGQIAAEVGFTTVGDTSYPHVNTTESYSAVFATLPKPTSIARDITSHDSSTAVSKPGGHKVISPQRGLFTAWGDGGKGKKRTGDSAETPGVLLTALARGYLTRRLLKSEKVQNLVNTIKDAKGVLASLDTPSSQQDLALRERVLTQLQVARLTLHEIFFDLPVREQLAYIAHSRVLRQERRLRLTENMSGRGIQHGRGRLSSATVKAMERRQRGTAAASKPQSKGHERAARPEKHVKPDKPPSRREGRTKTGKESSLTSTRVISSSATASRSTSNSTNTSRVASSSANTSRAANNSSTTSRVTSNSATTSRAASNSSTTSRVTSNSSTTSRVTSNSAITSRMAGGAVGARKVKTSKPPAVKSKQK